MRKLYNKLLTIEKLDKKVDKVHILRVGGVRDQTSKLLFILSMLVTRIKRIEKVSCAHRLHSPQLSDAENREIFGKCNNEFGHGHNYAFEAVIKGGVTNKYYTVNRITLIVMASLLWLHLNGTVVAL